MKLINYLSPSGYMKWRSDRKEFYLRYLADISPARQMQTKPMSVGSAFDAYVKADIHYTLFGNYGEYETDKLLEAQVEAHNLDWARDAGRNAFAQYKRSGALADLLLEISNAVEGVKMEVKVRGHVSHGSCVEDCVVLMGYPDIYFLLKDGTHAVYDWKVNGYCGTRNLSPAAGFVNCRDGWPDSWGRPSRNSGVHKNATIGKRAGISYNSAGKLKEEWAIQTCVYGWLLGTPVGEPILAGIEQLACSPGPVLPMIRIASHRVILDRQWQNELYKDISHVWNTCRDFEMDGETTIRYPHIFDNLPKDESDEKCRQLDDYHKAFTGDPLSNWLREVC